MSNQKIDGDLPGGTEPTAPAGTPEYFEQQLAKEREARTLMRERLRNTEALAAESHALRARMAEELERVSADRDRLRDEAAGAPAAAGSGAGAAPPAAVPEPAPKAPVAPSFTPRASDRPLRPPTPPRRKAPWLALTMLAGLAVGVAGLAWITGSMPGEASLATLFAPAAAPPEAAPAPMPAPAPVVAATAPVPPPAASVALASTAPASTPAANGAVALPPLAPETVLAATPTAAGAASTVESNVQSAALPARVRAALDAEGIAAPVDVDAATGRVAVSDPAADGPLRDRTDMIIRAVYAGASLPEPQIEHRWMSPPRAGRVASAALPAPVAAAPVAAAKPFARATSTRVAQSPTRDEGLANPPEAPAILPAGRVTESCKAGASARYGSHRAAEVAACMKRSCCSSANRQTEECRAYVRAYPSTCVAG